MSDNRSQFSIRIAALQRLFMWHVLSGIIPYYLVNEHPKSGGSWVGLMMSEYFRIPFIRNQRPPLFTKQVLQGHHRYSKRIKNVVCVIRDGRDVMVSAYHHMLFHNDRNSPHLVYKTRKSVPFKDYENVEKNMPAFIEYMFTIYPQSISHFRWDTFIADWIDKGVPIVKYEDLLTDTAGEMAVVIKKLTGQCADLERLRRIEVKYSFDNLSKQKQRQSSSRSFLRKGIAGDWKNKFTRAACEVFDHYAGDVLIESGYENNHQWMDTVSQGKRVK